MRNQTISFIHCKALDLWNIISICNNTFCCNLIHVCINLYLSVWCITHSLHNTIFKYPYFKIKNNISFTSQLITSSFLDIYSKSYSLLFIIRSYFKIVLSNALRYAKMLIWLSNWFVTFFLRLYLRLYLRWSWI